ncbi:MAG: ubiquinol-cytochrome c reductase iron-sulfur subunit [Helicobacteraceae bacterium]|jgi:ubiquinol-cytochrome c reductase iron-sulfur subunit|nr:ubiquinol-cytochrome c reductase iron-sulfur subunit [Helicobacteraceae bacterium]
MEYNAKRRGFIKGAGAAFGVAAAVGGVVALYGMKRTWDPLPSVVAAGVTEVDLSELRAGELIRVVFRKKPVYILKKGEGTPTNEKRDIIINGEAYTVVVAICTHLGCIPAWNSNTQQFKCACHGGEFDVSGVNTFGPPKRPLDIPPFRIDGARLVLGEEGEEYKRLASLD